MLLSILVGPAIARADEIETQTFRLPVTLHGKPLKLEVLVARPPGPGPFPVALLTHGSAGPDTNPENMRADRVLGNWSLDFAARGYLAVVVMRRGYGLSDGDVNRRGGTCREPVPGRFMQQDADDLQAALAAIGQRPDADMSRVIAIGQSLGGADVLALSSRADVGLSAVISVSGGIYHYDKDDSPQPFRAYEKCPAFRAALVSAIGSYGEKARMPHLWIYDENDPWFRPDLVTDLKEAWTKGGGQVQVEMVKAPIEDGHRLFFLPESRVLLYPLIDRFLRANRLPTWDKAPVDKLRERLSEIQRSDLDTYLERGTAQKALAVATDGSGRLHWNEAQGIENRAERRAVATCQNNEKKRCRLLMRNFELQPD